MSLKTYSCLMQCSYNNSLMMSLSANSTVSVLVWSQLIFFLSFYVPIFRHFCMLGDFFLRFLFFMCMVIFLSVCMSEHHMCAQCPEDSIESPRTRVTDSCRCWELNTGSLAEQTVLLAPAQPLLAISFLNWVPDTVD